MSERLNMETRMLREAQEAALKSQDRLWLRLRQAENVDLKEADGEDPNGPPGLTSP